MAIVDDYSAVAAELRRLQAERRPERQPAETIATSQPAPALDGRHRMRQSVAGDLLFRRLVTPRRRSHSAN